MQAENDDTQDQLEEANLRVTFVELHNENIHDLLASIENTEEPEGRRPCTDSKGGLNIRTIGNATTITGVREVAVGSFEELMGCLAQGAAARVTAATEMNSRSSRSHAIFTVNLELRRYVVSVVHILGKRKKDQTGCT